jgi:hypothetical protein
MLYDLFCNLFFTEKLKNDAVSRVFHTVSVFLVRKKGCET